MDTQKLCEHCGKPLGAKAVHGLCAECFLKVGLGSEAGGPSRSKSFVPPKPEELAPLFPQLEIHELLGKGGMGAVYKAKQTGLNRLVALKILPPDSGRDPAFSGRFTREAQALARLSHPGIVAVHEFGFVPDPSRSQAPDSPATERDPEPRGEGLYYFIMEFVDGVNLRQMLRAHRLSPREAMAIVPQVCEALQYAHDQGIVHRDIKPENVLVDKQGRVKIADFGLAKLLGKEQGEELLTQAAQVMGTPQYMAPEQLEKPLEVDHRADIYSLGVVFYEMLTGELPLGRFPAPSRKVEVDVRLDDIVLRALEKEPQLRYQQASVLKTEVETVAGSPQPRRSGPAVGEESPPPRRLGQLSLGLFLLGTLGTLALMTLSPRHEIALIFGGFALVLAVVLGVMGRRDRLSRLVLITTGVILASIGIAAIALVAPTPWRSAEAAKQRAIVDRAFDDLIQRARQSSALAESNQVSSAAAPSDAEAPHGTTSGASTTLESASSVLNSAIAITNSQTSPEAAPANGIGATRDATERPDLVVALAPPVQAREAWLNSSYVPPDFEAFFPDNREGGRRLDALWLAADKDSRPDEEILQTVHSGLRRTQQHRTVILRWIGNRYIWGKSPQDPEAIEIMYHAADFRTNAQPYGTRHYAVYFGLSVVQPKTPAILKTLADLCVHVDDPNDLERVAWGARNQQAELLEYVQPYHASRDPSLRSKARIVEQIMRGETNAFEWAAAIARQRAQALYAGELPRLRSTLSAGTSASRKQALEFIARERLVLIMDDDFVAAYAACAEDKDWRVRNEVARQAGEHWVWSAKEQHPGAIQLMLRLSGDENREVRDSAVYFGLSTVRQKDERLVRRLVEVALADEQENPFGNFGRIAWGLRGNEDTAARILDECLADPRRTERARRIYERITGRPPPSDQHGNRANDRELAAAQRALIERVERLIRNHTARIGHNFEIWERVRGSAGGYRIKPDITRIPLRLTEGSARPGEPFGEAFYLVEANRFYVQWNQPAANTLYYYGPFDGDPVRVLGLPGPPREKLEQDLAARYNAARQIISFSQRDAALASVTRDAARAGFAALAKKAVGEITAFSTRDEAAHQAARELARNGHRAEALEIAGTITSFSKRDAALRELAQ